MDEAHRLHRRDDIDTSIEAAERIVGFRTELQRRVLRYAIERGAAGFTDRELSEAMAERYHSGDILRTSTYRTRRSELTELGIIADTERRKTHPPGERHHAIWAIALDGSGLKPPSDVVQQSRLL